MGVLWGFRVLPACTWGTHHGAVPGAVHVPRLCLCTLNINLTISPPSTSSQQGDPRPSVLSGLVSDSVLSPAPRESGKCWGEVLVGSCGKGAGQVVDAF